ncbi:MAG: zinc-dependent metalloprotease [Bacteroidota bacterium]
MSKIVLYRLLTHSLIFFIISLAVHPAKAQIQRCATNETRQSQPKWLARQAAAAQQIQAALDAPSIQTRAVLKIPVVVHIVWNQAAENISDEQVLSQIEVLNQDFRAKNIEFATIPSIFREVAADTEIEFCLAQMDERDRPTTGITRTFTTEIAIANNQALIKNGVFGGADAWDTKRFLNIWVGHRDDNILGEATMPGEASEEEDGIVMDYRAFGTIGAVFGNEPYVLGRTLTHEVGHYLGLQHPWGSGFNNATCANDDGLSDTPIQSGTYADECPNGTQSSCNSSDMYMNFMNYTNDACMSMFSLQQKQRMLAVLQSVRRALTENTDATCEDTSTLTSNFIQEQVEIFPNPAQNFIQIRLKNDYSHHLAVKIYNGLGQEVLHLNFDASKEYLLSLEDFPSGIYYLHFFAGTQYFVQPVIVE